MIEAAIHTFNKERTEDHLLDIKEILRESMCGSHAMLYLAMQIKQDSWYIRKINVTGGGTHYFNVINGQVFDLTRD